MITLKINAYDLNHISRRLQGESHHFGDCGVCESAGKAMRTFLESRAYIIDLRDTTRCPDCGRFAGEGHVCLKARAT